MNGVGNYRREKPCCAGIVVIDSVDNKIVVPGAIASDGSAVSGNASRHGCRPWCEDCEIVGIARRDGIRQDRNVLRGYSHQLGSRQTHAFFPGINNYRLGDTSNLQSSDHIHNTVRADLYFLALELPEAG